jgi:hypothetical protein
MSRVHVCICVPTPTPSFSLSLFVPVGAEDKVGGAVRVLRAVTPEQLGRVHGARERRRVECHRASQVWPIVWVRREMPVGCQLGMHTVHTGGVAVGERDGCRPAVHCRSQARQATHARANLEHVAVAKDGHTPTQLSLATRVGEARGRTA